MITMKLSNIYSQLSSKKSKINKYINVLKIHDPTDPNFQEDFAYFDNFNTWLHEQNITAPISDVKKRIFGCGLHNN